MFEILNNSRHFELEKNIIELGGKIYWVKQIVKFELAPNAQSETLSTSTYLGVSK